MWSTCVLNTIVTSELMEWWLPVHQDSKNEMHEQPFSRFRCTICIGLLGSQPDIWCVYLTFGVPWLLINWKSSYSSCLVGYIFYHNIGPFINTEAQRKTTMFPSVIHCTWPALSLQSLIPTDDIDQQSSPQTLATSWVGEIHHPSLCTIFNERVHCTSHNAQSISISISIIIYY